MHEPAQVVPVAISGGAGFLGLHLARRLLADGVVRAHARRRPARRRRSSSAGSRRSAATFAPSRTCARSSSGATSLVHAAAALPIQSSRAAIRSVNVEGTATVLAACARGGRAARRPDLVDGRVRRAGAASDPSRTTRSSESGGTASRRSTPSRLRRVRPARARRRDHPAEDVRRPRAPRRLRDPLRLDPRRPPDPDPRRRLATSTSCSRSRISSTRSRARSTRPSGARRSTSVRARSAPCGTTSRR